MSDTPDALPTTAPEGQRREYTPITDPLMQRVTVIDELIPGQKAERMGYQTNILGAKVDLQALEKIIRRRERNLVVMKPSISLRLQEQYIVFKT